MSTITEQVQARLEREREQVTARKATASREVDDAQGVASSLLSSVVSRVELDIVNPDADLDLLRDAFADAERAARKAITALGKERALTRQLQQLDSQEELERRVAAAQQLAASRAQGRKPSAKTLAVGALLAHGEAMHYRDITKAIQESGLLELRGNTPEATVNAMLAVAAKKGDTFEKTAPGVFDLRDREGAQREAAEAARRAEQQTEMPPAPEPDAAPDPEPAQEPEQPAEEPPAPAEQPKVDARTKGGGTGSNQAEGKRDRKAAARKAAETRRRKREAAAAAADTKKANA